MSFIITSNIFLAIPVVISAWKGEWIYFAFAVALIISSSAYHYLKIKRSKSQTERFFKEADWIVAGGAYIYMYYFIFTQLDSHIQIPITIVLTSTLLFFWYGYKWSSYKKMHPWFHVTAFIVSGLIVFLGK